MQEISWQVGNTFIPYLMGYDCLTYISDYIAGLDTDIVLIVADSHLKDGYGDKLKRNLQGKVRVEIIGIRSEEVRKTLATLDQLVSYALACKLTRRSIIVGLGGGIVGNISGLFAALLFRGVRFVHIPTTLLSMHDSVTSMKQAINHDSYKNVIGTYYAPTAILVDSAVLHSLPEKHLRSALFELIKNALVLGGEYFLRLKHLLALYKAGEQQIWFDLVKMGVEAKCMMLRDDPKEARHAIIFEYGHTIGHALELSCDGTLSHGESVAWGMTCAALLSQRSGYLSDHAFEQHKELLNSLGPLHQPQRKPQLTMLLDKMQHDNKRGYVKEISGHVPMLLLKDIGSMQGELEQHFLTYVPLELIQETLLLTELVNSL